MLKIKNYEFVVATDPEEENREVIILTAERADIPVKYGTPVHARTLDVDQQKSIVLSFASPQQLDGQERLNVEFENVEGNVFVPLQSFSSLLLFLFEEGEVVEEYEVSLEHHQA